jgi:hypothetical protein
MITPPDVPIPPPDSHHRKALLIGNSSYVDRDIAPLLAPRADVDQLRDVLLDPNIGNFSVIPRFDLDASDFMIAISDLFSGATRNDVLLFYFAGHGVRDSLGRLYFAVRKTQVNRLAATAVPARYLFEELSKSESARKVLILDCCHAGAFLENGNLRTRGAPYDAALIRDSLMPSGSGTYILAASQSGQSAFEVFDPKTGETRSIYTNLIVEAIRNGASSPEERSTTISSIHRYVREHRNRSGVLSEPELSVFSAGDDLVLCQNPNVQLPLDSELFRQLTSETYLERFHAIMRLREVVLTGYGGQADKVRAAFAGRLNGGTQERDFELRQLLEAALTLDQNPSAAKVKDDITSNQVATPRQVDHPDDAALMDLCAELASHFPSSSDWRQVVIAAGIPRRILSAQAKNAVDIWRNILAFANSIGATRNLITVVVELHPDLAAKVANYLTDISYSDILFILCIRLTEIYPLHDDWIEVTEAVGIVGSNLSLLGSAPRVWLNILRYAASVGVTTAILKYIVEKNPELDDLVDAYAISLTE